MKATFIRTARLSGEMINERLHRNRAISTKNCRIASYADHVY